jgi:hypothetical protein
MQNYIIDSFILQNKNTLVDICNYIKLRCEKSIKINTILTEIKLLIKHDVITCDNKNYELTSKGFIILNDHKYYYSKIIINFFKKFSKNHKKYDLKEIRQEQQQLRNYLIENRKNVCIICNKKLPLSLLETAHLKPRCILNHYEINDKNVVEFMCRYCHKLYDDGYLAVYNGLLYLSSFIDDYDLHYDKNKQITSYNLQNKKYFIFHYKYIYLQGCV